MGLIRLIHDDIIGNEGYCNRVRQSVRPFESANQREGQLDDVIIGDDDVIIGDDDTSKRARVLQSPIASRTHVWKRLSFICYTELYNSAALE